MQGQYLENQQKFNLLSYYLHLFIFNILFYTKKKSVLKKFFF